jgi:CRP-like cAMP-binding protein
MHRVQRAAQRDAAILPMVAPDARPRRRDAFSLKQEFLAVMLGVQRPTVSVVLRALQREGLISTRYGRIQILQRKRLEAAACECYDVIRAHFARLGL